MHRCVILEFVKHVSDNLGVTFHKYLGEALCLHNFESSYEGSKLRNVMVSKDNTISN